MSNDKKPKPTCYECGEDIIFDPNKLGKYGKQIPLDPTTREPHKCQEVKEEEKKEEKKSYANTETGETKQLTSQEAVKANTEYVNHTLARPSEIKIFYADSIAAVEKEYREFQIGKRFAWTRAQYQPVVVNGIVVFSIAFFYEVAK